MRYWSMLFLFVLLGCQPAVELPSVPLPPEDLSTWAVPELVQPPTPIASVQALPEEKGTPGEKIYPFTPGTTFAATVPMGWPLDIVLERGEQVRNIVGGDRAPAEGGQAPRWEVKEGSEGTDAALRSHVFVTATAPGLTLGVIITSTKRTYYLTCKSVQTSPIRALKWRYPPD